MEYMSKGLNVLIIEFIVCEVELSSSWNRPSSDYGQTTDELFKKYVALNGLATGVDGR